ncbi:MAG: aminoglycoside phosphotransferase family protein [Burkholderiaceae bacterium]|nr:aminoglycoside phosphotransferase family protein [Burkholderiaceae bacterium]
MASLAPAPNPSGAETRTATTVPGERDLDTYTDAAVMRQLLQTHLPRFASGRLRIDTLSVRKVRRKTSRRRNPCPITLCYELQVSDLACGYTGTQMLYAKVFRAGLGWPAYQAQNRSRLTPPAFGEALVYLPDLNMLVWALPNDPDLPQLATLLDPAQVVSVLPWVALRASMGLACAKVSAVHPELLRYQPQCHATLRYTLTRVDGTEPCVVYAKTFFDSRAQDIHHRFEYFWQFVHADAPLVAQPLGYCDTTQTIWQAPAMGTPLLHALNPDNAKVLVGRVARALALLHDAPLSPSASAMPRSAAHWVAEARRRQKKITRVGPAMAARVARVADAIAGHAELQATRPLSLIHGDFHPEQIWIHQGRTVLFALDEFTLGDPMEDLAEFVLKFEQSGAAAELISALVEHYAAYAPNRFDQRSLNWHLTVQSLLEASRAFIFQQPGWANELNRRLTYSEARAELLNTQSTT